MAEHSPPDTDILYEGRDLEALASLHQYQDWMMKFFRPYLRGDGLEVGAGLGNIAVHLTPFLSSLELVEPSTNLIRPLAARFESVDNVTVTHKLFEEFVSGTADKKFDCVVMVNVLEHIEDDQQALMECYRILRPGGHLLIFVPALQVLFSKLDKMVGHFRRYERRDLEEKIKVAGFHRQECRFFDVVGIIPWWLLNTLGGATGFNPALVQLYDRAVVPISRALESVINPPYGKNLIAISKRP